MPSMNAQIGGLFGGQVGDVLNAQSGLLQDLQNTPFYADIMANGPNQQSFEALIEWLKGRRGQGGGGGGSGGGLFPFPFPGGGGGGGGGSGGGGAPQLPYGMIPGGAMPGSPHLPWGLAPQDLRARMAAQGQQAMQMAPRIDPAKLIGFTR